MRKTTYFDLHRYVTCSLREHNRSRQKLHAGVTTTARPTHATHSRALSRPTIKYSVLLLCAQ